MMGMRMPVAVAAGVAARMGRGVSVAVVAVHNVRGDELMQESGYRLDANESADEAYHHDEARRILGPAILLEVFFRLGEYAVQRRKQLESN